MSAVPDALVATPATRPWRRALAWLALLGPLFFLSYGWANALAAARVDVPSVVFGWERAIPFWAWTIVPYWSIDAFYAISLLVCRDRHELDRHALRLLSAQAVAIACFVLWPLRFSFVRPETDGVFGWLFDVLLGFDRPFNQAPSLHIVLLVLLWLRFGAHLRGIWRGALHAWAVLIGVSILTTYQHHFIDLPTGVLAGFFCAWLWPMRVATPWRHATPARDRARWRLAAAYALGALICAAIAWRVAGFALWLWWPTVSLALVALDYAVLGPDGFQKGADGRMSVAAQWLYAPYRLGAWINSRLWTRRDPAPVEVVPGLWLGRVPSRAQAVRFSTLIDCSAELSAPQGVHVVAMPMLDLVAPQPLQLRAAAGAIAKVMAESRGPVLACCALGYSRSAAAVATWLLRSGRAQSLDDAIAQLRRARPAIVLRAAHRQAIAAALDGARRERA